MAGRASVGLLLVGLVLAGCSGDQATGGRYRGVDDTGLPSHPIERGWMIAVPADAAGDLLGRPGVDGWAYHGVDVDEAEVLAAGGVWQQVGRGGRFDLPVEPGSWLVCAVGDGGGSIAPRTSGCSEVTIADGDQLLATVGEAGFWVERDD